MSATLAIRKRNNNGCDQNTMQLLCLRMANALSCTNRGIADRESNRTGN
jgi:hypothetical protein